MAEHVIDRQAGGHRHRSSSSRRREASFLSFLRVWLPASWWHDHWLSQRPLPAERAVMFHIGRSGSTVLTDLLDQHPDIDWAGEVVPKLYAPFRRSGWRIKPRVEARRLLLDSMAQAQARIYGCEVKFYHLRSLRLTLEQYLRAVEAMQFRHFIVLERRNYLRKIVSSLVARRRGRYHQPAGAEPDLTPITLHLDHVRIDNSDQPLIALLRAYARDLRRLDHLLAGRHVLKLTYEDDVMLGPHRGYRRACEFLGVPEAPVSVNYTRSNPFSLREIISNYNEVAAALADTEFAWMLEAD